MGLTPEQTVKIFKREFLVHLDRLERVATRERAEPDFNPEEARLSDTCMYWVYRLLDMTGSRASVDERAASQMETAGLNDATIIEVDAMLDALRRQGFVPERKDRLRAIVEAEGGEPSPMACMMAEKQIYRARSAACFQLIRRHDGIAVDDSVLIAQALCERLDQMRTSHHSPVRTTTDEPSARDCREAPIVSGTLPEHAQADPAARQETSADQPIATIKVVAADHFVGLLGEKLITERSAGDVEQRSWDRKTCKQARQTFALFAKYTSESGVTFAEELEQAHFAGLVQVFLGLAKSYGKSVRDEERSISELLAIGSTKGAHERGLAPETINRHITFLSQLVNFARAQGLKLDRDLDVSLLRRTIRGRARNKRGFFIEEELLSIFKLACFTGCVGWRPQPSFEFGNIIFHRALYYVPMLLFYTLARREEICGLEVADIFEVPYRETKIAVIAIRWNNQRRIKNEQSTRLIPLHPELVRLGFLEYVDAIRRLGYTLLFPDLKSLSSQAPLGDRFYDEFSPGLRKAIPEAALRKQVIHSIRRSAGDQLKEKGVSSERRGDILGHAGVSIAEEVYSNDTSLPKKAATLMKLPVVTKALVARPINLLPWVLRREPPPFSRPSRTRKQSA